jgi:Rps23 Pro-64 3,4-dihydroxylase Tpa1-like proline 4-hydroxylase
MRCEFLNEPFQHIIIHDFFTDNELSSVWKEINELQDSNQLKSEAETHSASDSSGYLKKNTGLFLHPHYNPDYSKSAILNSYKKIFDPNLVNIMSSNHWIYNYIKFSTRDHVLLSYYEDGGYYKPHVDQCSISMICNLFKEPKMFSGGDLCFDEFENYTIPLENNRALIFPSILRHSVPTITMHDNSPPRSGRYAISNFIYIG